jgi:uncharacterized protein YeaO (DUF488 family)
MTIRTKRIYDPPAPEDGVRILIDRVWPRGMRKADAHIDLWLRSIAPSSDLRKWFNHDPAKWDDFKQRYFAELQERHADLATIRQHADAGTVTLLYGARDTEHNNAMALKEYLEQNAGA